jgi:hypothetical protein
MHRDGTRKAHEMHMNAIEMQQKGTKMAHEMHPKGT